jgi:hypothetical protein
MLLPLLAGALLARAAGAAPEFELQAGYLTGANYGNPSAPVLGVRAGVDFDDRFTLSLRGALAHSDPVDYVGDGSRVNPSGVRGWSALLELRIHTSGLFQLHAAGALGVAQVTTWQCSCVESFALHGKPAVAAQLSAGARFLPGSSPRLSFGAEVVWARWAGLRDYPASYFLQARAEPVISFALLAGVGLHWR